jgi:hypothetical protein
MMSSSIQQMIETNKNDIKMIKSQIHHYTSLVSYHEKNTFNLHKIIQDKDNIIKSLQDTINKLKIDYKLLYIKIKKIPTMETIPEINNDMIDFFLPNVELKEDEEIEC